MNVGDTIIITELSTGKTWEERVESGSPSSGIFCSESGIPFWVSGVHWTPDIGAHQTKPKKYKAVKKQK